MRESSVRQGATMGTGSREREGVSPYGPWDTPAEPRRAADCLQRPLRSRFRQQLTPGVGRSRHTEARRRTGERCSYFAVFLPF
jgi:hypothetical protein